MSSIASKPVENAEEIAKMVAAFEARSAVTKVAPNVSKHLDKSKYIGRKILLGASPRLGCAPSAYLG